MRKKVNVLDIKMPEKKEMKVKKIIDCSKDLIQVNAELKEMLESTDDSFITVKNTKYVETSYMVASCGFDIETTTLEVKKEKEDSDYFSYMYIWQMCFGDYILIGRKWEQWKDVMHQIQEYYHLGKWDEKYREGAKVVTKHITRQAIVWIANSGFEFQFICRQKYKGNYLLRTNEEDCSLVFSDKKRKPISFELDFSEDDGAGFRCLDCLRISGGSLDSLAKSYCVTRKKKGDLDYKKLRNSQTPLTEEEMQYCLNDVIILNEWDYYYKEAYMKQVSFVPVTSTGLIRKAVKQNWDSQKYKGDSWLFRQFPKTLQEYLYVIMNLYRGGYTHANIKFVGKLLDGVHGMDFTSSYPSVMFQEFYPISDFVNVPMMFTDLDIENFDKLYNGNGLTKCWYADVTFYGLHPTSCHSLESVHKVKEYMELGRSEKAFVERCGAVVDNGKVLASRIMSVVITEEDWYSYKEFYKWDFVEVHCFKCANAGKLPDYLLDVVKEMYKRKSRLKKKELDGTIDYIIAKSFVNGTYGLCVQRLHLEDILFIPESGWKMQHPNKQDKIDGQIRLSEVFENPTFFNNLYLDNIRKIKTFKNGCQSLEMQLQLSPYWGIWITAHARRRITHMIHLLGDDCIYSDTDSVYFINYEKHKHIFDEWNQAITDFNKKLFGDLFDDVGDLGTFDPVVIKGENNEGEKIKSSEYSFKTYGAKRYIKYDKYNNVEITIAGLPKESLKKYAVNLLEKSGIEPTKEAVRKVIVDKFRENLILNMDVSDKRTHCYHDSHHSHIITDENNVSELMEEESSISIYDIPFTLKIKQEWLLMAYKIQKEGMRYAFG